MRRWRDRRRQMFADDPFQVCQLASAGSEFVGPGTTGMQDVPRGPLLVSSTSTGVVVAEAVESLIPQRPERANQQRFAERNPDVVDHQVATIEVGELRSLAAVRLRPWTLLPRIQASDAYTECPEFSRTGCSPNAQSWDSSLEPALPFDVSRLR
jgi:hypothetical protein